MAYAWNIIFLAIDNNSVEQDNKLISKTKNRFVKEFVEFKKAFGNNNIRISMLEYFNNSITGNAIFSYCNNNSNTFYVEQQNNFGQLGFNCQSEKSYMDFFKYSKSNFVENSTELPQKNVIVFLAHCTSLSFFETRDLDQFYKNKSSEVDNYDYFSVLEFKNAISKIFGDNNIESLLALNCTLQNFENNYALRNTVKYIIGSEQPLAPRYLSFEKMFTRLHNSPNTTADEIWVSITKDFYNSYEKYKQENPLGDTILKSENENYKEFISFQLSVCETKLSIKVLEHLNIFSAFIETLNNENDYTDLLFSSKTLIEDPSINNIVGMIDVIQYFENYRDSIIKSILIQKNHTYVLLHINSIIESLEKLIVISLKSPDADSIKTIKNANSISYKKYTPNGLAFFMPSMLSITEKITEKIWQNILLDETVKHLDYLQVPNAWIPKMKIGVLQWLNTGNNNHLTTHFKTPNIEKLKLQIKLGNINLQTQSK